MLDHKIIVVFQVNTVSLVNLYGSAATLQYFLDRTGDEQF